MWREGQQAEQGQEAQGNEEDTENLVLKAGELRRGTSGITALRRGGYTHGKGS